MVWTPLVLDDFVFDEARLETPESFGDVGGVQLIEQHDFPGGTRTQRSYGYFPAAQRWRAKFHGIDASQRAHEVGRIMASGQEVKLQYGDHSWLGRVARFSPTVRHNWLFEYEIEFWPRIDYANPGVTVPPPTDYGTVMSLHILALQSLIQYGLDPNLLGQVAAAEIGGAVGFYASQTLAIMAQSGGIITNISASNRSSLQALSRSTLATLAPYQVSANPLLSSPASDAAARVQAIAALAATAQPPITVIQAINPSLPVLAAQYYSDATAWKTIAAANGISDPQPVGTFNLTIPQQEP